MFLHLQISDTLMLSAVPKHKVHLHPASAELHYQEQSLAFELKQFSTEEKKIIMILFKIFLEILSLQNIDYIKKAHLKSSENFI